MVWKLGWTVLPSPFPGGDCYPYAISADGSTIVGEADDLDGNSHPVVWTVNGVVDLGTFGGTDGFANSASFDGSVIVGCATDVNGNYRAFRWTAAGGKQDILAGQSYADNSFADTVSYDGTIIAGNTNFPSHSIWRWTAAGGPMPIPLPPDAVSGSNWACTAPSGQHLVAFFFSAEAPSTLKMLTWTPTGGTVDPNLFLPSTSGGGQSDPLINDDGIIWATGSLQVQNRAKLWKTTTINEETDLGELSGFPNSTGDAVTVGGNVVAGNAYDGAGNTVAFWWTQATGMRQINPPPGFNTPQPTFAQGLSADGLTFSAYLQDDARVSYAAVYRMPAGGPPPVNGGGGGGSTTTTDAPTQVLWQRNVARPGGVPPAGQPIRTGRSQ